MKLFRGEILPEEASEPFPNEILREEASEPFPNEILREEASKRLRESLLRLQMAIASSPIRPVDPMFQEASTSRLIVRSTQRRLIVILTLWF